LIKEATDDIELPIVEINQTTLSAITFAVVTISFARAFIPSMFLSSHSHICLM
jgi:hypothetical protein